MSIHYPYKKDNKWKVFHMGEDHDFKDFDSADAYCRQLSINLMCRGTPVNAFPSRCSEGCGNYTDPPSSMCPGCQAYKEHQS